MDTQGNERPCFPTLMQKPPRPWATFILAAVALAAALLVEVELGRAPTAGLSLVVALPLLALGFGIDWWRLAGPSRSRAIFVTALALTTVALPFALALPMIRALILIAGLGFVLAAVGAHVWARWAGRIVEATYVGQRGQRSVFVDADSCWALHGRETFSMQAGDRVAFRFRGQELRTEDGPFRTRQQVDGTLLEIAESLRALRAERKRSALWVSNAVLLAAGAGVVELALLSLFVVS